MKYNYKVPGVEFKSMVVAHKVKLMAQYLQSDAFGDILTRLYYSSVNPKEMFVSQWSLENDGPLYIDNWCIDADTMSEQLLTYRDCMERTQGDKRWTHSQLDRANKAMRDSVGKPDVYRFWTLVKQCVLQLRDDTRYCD